MYFALLVDSYWFGVQDRGNECDADPLVPHYESLWDRLFHGYSLVESYHGYRGTFKIFYGIRHRFFLS